MSILPCTSCKRRPRGKLATIYISWFAASERVSKKHKLCFECAEAFAGQLQELRPIRDDAEYPENCPACGMELGIELEPTYLNIFPPKADPIALILAQCETCATPARVSLTEGAERLADRRPEVAHEPSPFDALPWGVA